MHFGKNPTKGLAWSHKQVETGGFSRSRSRTRLSGLVTKPGQVNKFQHSKNLKYINNLRLKNEAFTTLD